MITNLSAFKEIPHPISIQNIAKGTTDPGYKVYNLNYLFN